MKTITSVQITPEKDESVLIKNLIKMEGAVILKNIVNKAKAEDLKTALLRALDEDRNKYGESYLFYGMVHALMNRGEEFIDLIAQADLHNIFKTILGHGCIIHAYNSSSMPGNKSNFSRSIHVDTPRLIPGYITNMGITIALDKFTPDNGAMEIMPSSFNDAVAPSEEKFENDKIVLGNLEVGDAILFNARCWHRGGINKTTQWRHAVSINICRAYMRQQFDYSTMLGEEKMNTLSDNVKQFLGHFVRMPNSMEEFLLPADKRKYKAGQE
jgi:ectoine hydroxylase-related dioxygenase (phytanoyl-CoA dioxygenase family)